MPLDTTKSKPVFRRSRMSDERSVITVLNQLSPTTEVTGIDVPMILEYVLELSGAVVGTGTLIVVQKRLRDGGRVGFVEDIVVDEPHRRQGFGKAMLERLVQEAKRLGCYKVVLGCHEKNVPFYEACGFHRHEVLMRRDVE